MKKKILLIADTIKRAAQKAQDKLKGLFSGVKGQKGKSPFKVLPRTRGRHAVRINKKRLCIAGGAAAAAAAILITILVAGAKPSGTAVLSENSSASATMETTVSDTPEPASPSRPVPEEEIPAEPEESAQPKEKEEKITLEPGVHSPEVVKLQERLMELDYMEPDEPTDYYGPQTEYSLQLFQRKHGLQVDGIAGEKTLELLYSKKAKHYTVFLGENGTDIEELQKRLIELKYLKGKATGYFGTDTEAAVKEFQKQNNLKVDGNVGSNTREALYSEDAKEKPAPGKKPPPKKKPDKKPAKKTPSTKRVPDAKKVNALIEFAKKQLGKRYVRGGKGPDTFDCSGFVYYCLKNIGFKMSYKTSGGWASSSYPRVNKMSELKAGDIVCFRGHVGIYLGGGKMIDASSSQGKIRITSGSIRSSSYWTRNFICGRRVL